MYTENPAQDVLLFVKAFVSNQIARFAPELYVRITGQTGRGSGEEDSLEIARYFIECFYDYGSQLRLNEKEFSEYLRGKIVLEYGPGDVLGMALLLYAHGAEAVHCVDRFPLVQMTKENISVHEHLLDLLGAEARLRAECAFREEGNPASGFKPELIKYSVTENGLVGVRAQYDLIISRAVLQHVNNLQATMFDIAKALKPGGISLHEVDLRSLGLDRYVIFDFLTWPRFLYRLMFSHKGYPNRWRINAYRYFAEHAGLIVRRMIPIGHLPKEEINIILPKLAKEFRGIPPEELAWVGFWMHLEHPDRGPGIVGSAGKHVSTSISTGMACALASSDNVRLAADPLGKR